MNGAPRRVAVLGCGDISAVHLAAIDDMPDAELVAVGDPDEGRRAAAQAAWSVPGFADHRALLEAVRPDVVHVCTPHATHADLAVDALEAGAHVVLEKPLAHSRAAGLRLLDAAERASTQVAVCFQNRYNAPVQAAHELIASGRLGEVVGAAATVFWHRDADYYRDRPWRGRWATAGGGLLMNQAIHTIDLLQWLLGDVDRVTGGAGTRLLGDVIEVEDTADLVLQHRNGAISTVFATLSHVVNAPVSIEITTDRATLELRGELTVTHEDGRVDRVAERGAQATHGRSYWGVSHQMLIRDFYDGLDSGHRFWIDPRAAWGSLDIVQHVYDQAFPNRESAGAGTGNA